jgi:hypothetical protein
MQSSLRTAAEHPPKPKPETAAQGVGPLNGGECGKSLLANFQANIIAERRFASRLKARPIGTAEHVRAGGQPDGKAAALSDGEVRPCR